LLWVNALLDRFALRAGKPGAANVDRLLRIDRAGATLGR